MLFICKKKWFIKNAKKILPERDYFIIDGEDVGSSVSSKKQKTVSDKFAHCTSNGEFTPSNKLMRALLENDNEYPDRKIKDMIEDHFHDKNTTIAIISSVKAMFASQENDEINIFVVLPNKVYKTLADKYKKRYEKLFDTDFDFVFTSKELDEKPKLLTKELSSKKRKEIIELIRKNEKKFKLVEDEKENEKSKKKKKKDKH